MKVGDLVTSYWKGFYEIVKIERRWENKDKTTPHGRSSYCFTEYDPETCGKEMRPLLFLTQRYTAEGTLIRGKAIRTCDSSYCHLAENYIPNEIKRLETIIENLKKIKYE